MHAAPRLPLMVALGLVFTLAWGDPRSSLAASSSGHASAESAAGLSPARESQAAPQSEREPRRSTRAQSARASAPTEADSRPATYRHAEQFGLRLGLVQSFKAVSRYDDSPPCDDTTGDQRAVCPVLAPLALDLALSYAVLDTIEPFIWTRLGLAEESKTRTAAARWLGAGLRIYSSADSRFKLFFEPSVAVQLEGAGSNAPDAKYSTDFFSRLQFGGQFDINRYAGAYLTLGPSVSFVRAIALGLETNAGVQARFP